jgi:hypothetical protein
LVKNVGDGGGEAVEQVEVLAFFPAEEGDGLGVVPHPDEAVTEIRLLLVLVIVQAHQLAADEDADGGARDGVGDHDGHEQAGNHPQHADERDQGDQ